MVGDFCPDPIRNTTNLNAEIIDAKGMRQTYEFPRLGNLTWWERIPRYRNCKFTANMSVEEYNEHRTFTARHVVRQLGMAAEAFPVWVSLYYEFTDSPPPGTGVADPMASTRVRVLDRFQFRSLKEVMP